MKKWLNWRLVLHLVACGILSVEVVLLMDGIVVFCGGELPVVTAAAVLAALTLVLWGLLCKHRQLVWRMTVVIPAVLALTAICCYGGWSIFGRSAGYEQVDAGKNQIYGNRKVMVIVPHQDDELNVLGGVMEEYVRYGSELYAVFITNGDYLGIAETRYREALAVMEDIGVPEDHVVFLGYGNEWAKGGPHIYNAGSGMTVSSYLGRTRTYGTIEHPAYREGREYTIDNLEEDLKSVILEYMPDVICCSDYDNNIDHKATTLLFDRVMGQLLKENRTYAPVVYKAYAYGTAWEADPDFCTENILSTRNHFDPSYGQKPAVYRWEDRTRFPVGAEVLSRSLPGSGAFEQMSLYRSQGAASKAICVVNGDKVAWRRYTDSLCLDARIRVSSGNGGLLNDFMLIDNHNLVDETDKSYDGVWIPKTEDGDKTAEVTLAEKSPVCTVALYDHPSEEHNILNAVICFDDGTQVETGPLDPGGAATVIEVAREAVSSFKVTLTETQGEDAGLSEIEAFARQPEADGRFIKLMDEEGNFLYDYRITEDGTAELSLYIHGSLPALTAGDYHIGITGQEGTAVIENGVIRVTCPPGETFTLTVACDSAGVSDSIFIRNPGMMERLWTDFWQKAEAALFSRYSRGDQNKLLICSIPEKISYVLRHMA